MITYLKNIVKVLFLIALGVAAQTMQAQELHCTVEINTSKLEGTNKSVFETLQTAVSDYFNETRFSNATYAPVERIECRFFLTVDEYNDDRIKGELQVQLSRPVYNSTYTTTLFNFKDSKIDFEYKEGDPLIFNESTMESNLTAILNYYAYLFLALDSDSFSPLGGQPYWDRLASVVQMAQSSGEVGWRAFEDTKNRSAVLSAYTETAGGALRQMLYDYHRKGLDEMVTSPDKGRAMITSTLPQLKKVYDAAPMSVGLSIFRDSKLDELVNVYSKGSDTERKEAYDILQPLYPTENERLEKIRKGDEQN